MCAGTDERIVEGMAVDYATGRDAVKALILSYKCYGRI